MTAEQEIAKLRADIAERGERILNGTYQIDPSLRELAAQAVEAMRHRHPPLPPEMWADRLIKSMGQPFPSD